MPLIALPENKYKLNTDQRDVNAPWKLKFE